MNVSFSLNVSTTGNGLERGGEVCGPSLSVGKSPLMKHLHTNGAHREASSVLSAEGWTAFQGLYANRKEHCLYSTVSLVEVPLVLP